MPKPWSLPWWKTCKGKTWVPVEEAMGYRQLMEACGYTQAQAAEKVSKSRSAVANSLRLLNLPPQA